MILDEVCEFIVDAEHKTAPTQNIGLPSIRTPNIGKGRLLLKDVRRVSEETYRNWTRRAVPQVNDLILAREAPVGNVAIIPEGLNVCLGQRTVLLRPDPTFVSSSYLCYYLISDQMQNLILSRSGGSTVDHLNMRDIRALELGTLPILPTQQKIASILSAYDDLIENNLKRIRLLEEAAQNIYKEWFVHFRFPGYEEVEFGDGAGQNRKGRGLPEGWEKKKLHDTLTLNYGKALKKENRNESGQYPVYGSSGIVGYHDKSLVGGIGIILGRKGNVGSTYFSHDDFYPIDTVYYVSTEISLFYCYILLKNETFINSDAAVPGLNRNYAYSKDALLPPQNLLGLFDTHCEPLFNQIYLLTKQIQTLKEARDILLPRLMDRRIEV